MKRFFGIVIAAVFCLSLALGSSWAKPQETCPVMGGKINKVAYADHQGNRIYFCCPACLDPFKKEPDKYVKKMESEGIELEKAPTAAAEKK